MVSVEEDILTTPIPPVPSKLPSLEELMKVSLSPCDNEFISNRLLAVLKCFFSTKKNPLLFQLTFKPALVQAWSSVY